MNSARSRPLSTGWTTTGPGDISALGRSAAGARARGFALIRAEPARVGIAAGAVAERGHPRIALRHLFGVADVEDRGTLGPQLRLGIEGAEQAVPEIVGDAEVALLVMEVMGEVILLDLAHEGALGRRVEMLHAVAELVEQGREDAHG